MSTLRRRAPDGVFAGARLRRVIPFISLAKSIKSPAQSVNIF